MRALANLKHSVRREIERRGEDFDDVMDAAAETVAHATPPTGEARRCAWCGGWDDGWMLTTEPHVKRCECALWADDPTEDNEDTEEPLRGP